MMNDEILGGLINATDLYKCPKMLQMLGLQMRDFSEVVRGGLGVRFLLQMHDFSEVRRVGLGFGFFYKCLTSLRS
jgi:hypothetical protein